MDIERKLADVVGEVLERPASELAFDEPVTTGLGATSVQLIEIVAAVENAFDVEIGDEDILKMRTLNDLADFIKGQRV